LSLWIEAEWLDPVHVSQTGNTMSAARLFRIADKVLMTVITAALIVAVPVSAVAFVVQTL
jgi:hypothetical protein